MEPSHSQLSIQRQCQLIDLHRSTYYFLPAGESVDNLAIMRLIDAKYLLHPFYGSRKLVPYLRENGFVVNRKRVQRLLRLMGLFPIYPKPNLSKPQKGHKVYPYLLRNLPIIERLWRSVKYELIYLKDLCVVPELYKELSLYFGFYNNERFHQALDNRRPVELYCPA